MNRTLVYIFFVYLYIFFPLVVAKLSWTVLHKDENNNDKIDSPGPREGHATAAIGNLLYSFGGRNLEGDYFNDLHVFHRTTRSWSEIKPSGDAPIIREGATLNVMQNSLWLFGGMNNDGSLNDVYKFDSGKVQWLRGEPTENFRPEARSGHAAATDGSGKLYIFGGYNTEGIYLDDLWVLDANVDAEYINEDAFPLAFRLINPNGPLPTARESASLTYVDGKLYLLGGYGPSGIQSTNVHAYDIKKNEWEHITSINGPTPREGHAGIRSGKSVIIVGGCDITRGVNRCYNDIWSLDTETFRWTLLSDHDEKFTSREGHTATFVAGGRVIIFGGSKGGNYVFSDVLEVSGFDMCGDPVVRCSGHGKCFEIGCSCDIGYGTHDCGEFLTCPNGCHNNGICFKGDCTCFPGYIGPSCFKMAACPGSCPKGDCNGNGTCSSRNKCICNPGFSGNACEFHIANEVSKTVIAKRIASSQPIESFSIANQPNEYNYGLMQNKESISSKIKYKEEAEQFWAPDVLSSGLTIPSNIEKYGDILLNNLDGLAGPVQVDSTTSKEKVAISVLLRIVMAFISISTGTAVIAVMIFLNNKRRDY